MKFSNIIFLLFMVFGFSLLAQNDNPIFFENFDNNDAKWTVDDAFDTKSYIKDGSYYMINKTSSSYYAFWNDFELDASKDFSIEIKIKALEGDDNCYQGVVFCANSIENRYSFSVSDNGFYRPLYVKDSNYDNDKWLETDFINEDKKYNVLKVKKENNYINYYINGNKVDSKPFKGGFGNYFGFIVSSSSKVKADYIKIYGTKPKINIVKNPITAPLENLGKNINTSCEELHPIISPDGKILYFVRDDYPLNTEDPDKNDIWYSEFKNRKWTKAKNIDRPINNAGNNALIAVTPDNNTLILKSRYNAWGEEIGRGFSKSTKNDDGSWSIPQNIDVDNYYNNGKYSSFSLSADLEVLISDIEHKNTYGKNDLYVSFLKSDGSYTEPENMGAVINTPQDEGTPFLASDGKTLYFSSEGHPGYGSSDIYVTKRIDNTWKNWTTPLNLGPVINSPHWDAYFTIDAQGEYAYLVSSSSGFGEEDIFRVKLPKQLQPEPVVILSGKVLDKNTNKPLSAEVFYDNFYSGKQVAVSNSNASSGKYKVILTSGAKYGIFAKKSGYFAQSDYIDLTQIEEFKEIEKNLYLSPISVNDKIALNNVFFKTGEAKLLTSSYPELNRLVKIMKINQDIEIQVQGHTNNIGNKNALIDLSEQRATEVKKYLVKKGITPGRITTKGFGASKPVADNSTFEGRRKNQRVEFIVTKK